MRIIYRTGIFALACLLTFFLLVNFAKENEALFSPRKYPEQLNVIQLDPFPQQSFVEQGSLLGVSPSNSPSNYPTRSPLVSPSKSPSISPSKSPSTSPSKSPSTSPSTSRSISPTVSLSSTENCKTIQCSSNISSDGYWCKDIDTGIPRNVKRTYIRRTYRGFLECLSNKTIIFSGDSRVRFQFLSLMFYLIHKRWIYCKDESSWGNENDCYILWIFKFKEWSDYTRYSLPHLVPYSYMSSERNSTIPPENVIENRNFSMKTEFGEIKLYYYLNFVGKVNFKGDLEPFNVGNPAFKFSLSTAEAMELLAKTLHPTHIFANSGWDLSPIGCLLMDLKRKFEFIEGVWEISHFSAIGQTQIPIFAPRGCNISFLNRAVFTLGLPKTSYFDYAHMKGSVNEELNHWFLDELCGSCKS